MKKPAAIVDRATEWGVLTAAWIRAKPELIFCMGRRRVGKSFLLVRFAREAEGIYYQATRRTEPEQLANLSRILGEHFQDAALLRGVPFPDWESLFAYLADRAAGERFLLVLDEFPYLASAAPALPSILQSLWDHSWPETKFKLVLSGSHVTAMRQLEAEDQPLYGRRTARLILLPFPYHEIAHFLPDHSASDRLVAYGIFGGLPGHLALLDPAANVGSNVAAHLLSPSGRLLDEAQHLLDAFLTEAEVHYSIIEAIARGEQTWSRLTSRVGRSGGALLRPLQWLEEMQILARVVPITAAAPQKSRRALYRIRDPYLAFWHRFVSPLVNAGMVGLVEPERLWHEQVAPRLDDYMGGVFEEACRTFVGQTRRLPFAPLRVGQWWDSDSRNQIDVVALGGSGDLLVGECKWGGISAGDLRMLRERGDLLSRELPEVRRIHYALFSGRGLADEGVRAQVKASEVLHFTIDDLFRTGEES